MRYMYKQLMSPPYCMLASDIDNMTFSQMLLYFASDEEIKGVRKISTSELKQAIREKTSPKDKMTREEFLKRGEEIRKRKKEEFEKRRKKRIEAARGSGRKKR